MEKINKIKVKGIDHEITLTDEEAKNVVDKQLLTKAAVPVDGVTNVDKVYFNTSLTNEQVVEILKSITYVGGLYTAFLTKDKKTALVVFSSSGSYGIEVVNSEMQNEVVFALGTSFGFTGWNPNITNPFTLNAISITETTDDLGTYAIGDQNDLIKDLVYVQSEKFISIEDVDELPDESGSYNPNVIYRKPVKEYHLYSLEDGEAFNFSEFLKSQGGTVNFIEVSELPAEPSVVMDEATYTITLYILNKTDLYGYMNGWLSNDELVSTMSFGAWGGIVNSLNQINAENTGYVLAKIKQYSYANIKDGVKSEFVTNKDKALPLIIEMTGKTTANEDFNIEEVIDGVTITYEEAKTLYDSPNAQIKLSFIYNGDVPAILTFNKDGNLDLGDSFIMTFSCNYSSTRMCFLSVTGITPSSQAGIAGVTLTYATKSDVLKEIDNYMKNNFENGNEGSY